MYRWNWYRRSSIQSHNWKTFVGLALLWQLVILYLLGEAAPTILIPSLIDPILGVLFMVAYRGTPSHEQGPPHAWRYGSSLRGPGAIWRSSSSSTLAS
jgi:hypothetical protein